MNYINYASTQLIIAILIIFTGIIHDLSFLTLFGISLLIFILYFFRDGNPVITYHHVVSPSQSTVTNIRYNIDPDDEAKLGDYVCIETYLSPLDKHFLVIPVSGTIIDIENNKKDRDLENVRITIKDKHNDLFFFDQIVEEIGNWGWLSAIFINKRVIIDKQIDDEVEKGDKYGIIRFGSKMRYYLPSKYKLSIKIGDKLNQGDGLTIA